MTERRGGARRWPIRWRLAAAYTAAFAVLLLLAGAAAWAVVARATLAGVDASLRDVSGAVSVALRRAYGPRRGGAAADRADSVAVTEILRDFRFRDLGLAVFALGDPRGATVVLIGADTASAASVGLANGGGWQPLAPVAAHVLARRDTQAVTVDGPGGSAPPERVLAVPVDIGLNRLALFTSLPLARRQLTLTRFRDAMLIGVPVALVLAALGGYGLARAALAPVDAMSLRVRAIEAGTMHERLPDPETRDELGRLARTFNGLLDRLERAFDRQRQFTADASHELRGPVAIVRAEAERAIAHATRPEAEYRRSLAVIAAEARRLALVVDDLFLLARVDAGDQALVREPLFLEEVLDAAVDASTGLAATRAITLSYVPDAELPIRGDARLLRRCAMNLLDNALKYTDPGGRVVVTARRAGALACVEVTDTGGGIPREEWSRIFRRFYRVRGPSGASGVGDSSGAGLGLPIARWIAEAHEGTLAVVESGPGGTTMRLTMPLAASADASPGAADGDATDGG